MNPTQKEILQKFSQQNVELSSVKIVRDAFEEGRQFIKSITSTAKRLSSIAAEENKKAAKLADKMERAADSLEKSAKAIGIDIREDMPEVKATQMYAEDIRQLSNAFSRIAVLIQKELSK